MSERKEEPWGKGLICRKRKKSQQTEAWTQDCCNHTPSDLVVKESAQFTAVCSSAKPCEIGKNLLSVSDPISRLQERLIHVGALIRPPTLQLVDERRPVSGLHPYAAVERSSPPMSPVPEP